MIDFPKWLISDPIINKNFRNITTETNEINIQNIIFFIFTIIIFVPTYLICIFVVSLYRLKYKDNQVDLKSMNIVIGNDYKMDNFYAEEKFDKNNKNFTSFNQFEIKNFFCKSFNLSKYYDITFDTCLELFKITRLKGVKLKFFSLFSSLGKIHYYVIYRTFFSYLRQNNILNIFLVSMPLSLMCAAEKEKLKCIVYMHGLSVKLLPMQIPLSTELHLISLDEMEYYSNFIPKDKVKLLPVEPITNPKNCSIILLRQILDFSKSSGRKMDLNDIKRVQKFSVQNGLDLYYKIHPKTDRLEIESLISSLKIKKNRLLINKTPITENIKKLKPKLVFGWFSGGLAESLNHRVLPIIIEPLIKTKKIDELSVFKFEKRCLILKKDYKKIERALQNNNYYYKTIEKLNKDGK